MFYYNLSRASVLAQHTPWLSCSSQFPVKTEVVEKFYIKYSEYKSCLPPASEIIFVQNSRSRWVNYDITYHSLLTETKINKSTYDSSSIYSPVLPLHTIQVPLLVQALR